MLKIKRQLVKRGILTNWLSRKWKKFDKWVHEEDHRLRRFTNMRRIREKVLEHVRKWRRGVRELEGLDEELKSTICKEYFEALDTELKMKRDLKSNNDEAITHRSTRAEINLPNSITMN